jgi:hypothetical protein
MQVLVTDFGARGECPLKHRSFQTVDTIQQLKGDAEEMVAGCAAAVEDAMWRAPRACWWQMGSTFWSQWRAAVMRCPVDEH